MRIAHIIWGLSTGGAETMLVDIANEQVKTEEVAIVIVNNTIEETLFRKIDSRCVIRLCNRKVGSRSIVPWIKLNVFLLKYSPDIIHFHLEGMRKMVLHPAPKVFTIHNTHTSGREYSRYHALYAISDGVKDYTLNQGFLSTTVWNGINTDIITTKAGVQYKAGEICHIICVGRLFTPHKGQDILLDALALLLSEGEHRFHLDLIGEGESRGTLEKIIRKKSLQKEVKLLGHKDRGYVYQHLADYDLFVLPSRSEGFGLSVAEAMCAKVPVLVSDLDGVLDVINNGAYGQTFKTGDAGDLALKIKAFITKGEDVNMIQRAYSYARDQFDIKKTARRYIEEYKKVLTI